MLDVRVSIEGFDVFLACLAIFLLPKIATTKNVISSC